MQVLGNPAQAGLRWTTNGSASDDQRALDLGEAVTCPGGCDEGGIRAGVDLGRCEGGITATGLSGPLKPALSSPFPSSPRVSDKDND